jgi:hypothetical protein
MCSACSNNPQQALIEQIEAQITLPAGSLSKERYSRYYALGPDKRISGVYIVHRPSAFADAKAACREYSIRKFPCSDDGSAVELIAPGESLWLDDHRAIPGMNGGGCAQVSFEYEPASKRFYHLECNGSY